MNRCEFCGSELPDQAKFCGQCGKVQSDAVEGQTQGSGFEISGIHEMDTATSISVPGNFTHEDHTRPLPGAGMPTVSLDEEVEEEERRRRAAMLGLAMPLLGSLAADGRPYAGNVPVVQGTPQIEGAPSVPGTPQAGNAAPSAPGGPQMPGNFASQGFYSNPTIMAPQLPVSPSAPNVPAPTTTLHPPHQPHPPQPQGCSRIVLIVAIIIPIFIILSFIGLSLTVFAPNLTLSGSSNVEQGGTLTLHGSNFIPGSSVTLTLDDTIPLYFTSHSSPVQETYAVNSMQILGIGISGAIQSPLSGNTVPVSGDGTFTITINVSPGWAIGKHTIKASESISHRSAGLVFTIFQPGATPSPSATVSASATPSLTTTTSPTVTVTPTATTTTAGLSCVNPPSLTLGPVSAGYSQAVSSTVSLCTTGTGTVNWTASWNQNAAPWLQLDHTSGAIAAPGQAQINVGARATNLTPGSYTAAVTFNSLSNSATETLNISFTVQAGCVNGTPAALTFTGVANRSDPATQAIAITNCGPPGTWSATTQTANGGNWLFASPTGNTLNGGATASVTITASNLKAKLPAGTYTGNVTFTIGTGSFTVKVTLNVMSAPILTVTPTSLYANQQCSSDPTGGYWICYVSLTNTSTTLNLSWSASSSGIKGISFKPASSTLSPRQTIRVQIMVPKSDCPVRGTLSFTGPANTVTVTWSCTIA
jgi:hypothetical protein